MHNHEVLLSNDKYHRTPIAGGDTNYMGAYLSQATIAGGIGNYFGGESGNDVISGGYGNAFPDGWTNYAVIGGGDSNRVRYKSDYGFIGGGGFNSIDTLSTYSVIGGGQNNLIAPNSEYAVIAGGDSNDVTNGPRAFVGGGCYNNALAKWGTIGGGCGNVVTDMLTFIGGGEGNLVDALGGVIVGGEINQIQVLTGNSTKPLFGTIGGGVDNTISALNPIYLSPLPTGYNLPLTGTIAGGVEDTVSGHFAGALAGFDCRAIGKYSTVLGGRGLLAQDYQTVVGRLNDTTTLGGGLNNWGIPETSPPPIGWTGINALVPEKLLNSDAPTFIVGNGGLTSPDGVKIIEHRSDAFTVSDDGHSTVFQTLGNFTPTTKPIVGARYTDNTIIAWADVPAAGGTVANLGVLSVFEQAAPNTNVYIVTLAQNTSYDIPSAGLMAASIVATPRGANGIADANGCIEINVSEIGNPAPNEFIVHTYLNCQPNPEPFFFQVVGR